VPIRPIRELSLRQLLLLLTMLTSGIGLVLGCLGFLVFDMHSAREQKVEDLRSAADLIGTNSTAALAFDDAMGGSRLLAALSMRGQIRMGVLYRSDGTYFASYMRSDLNAKILPRHRLTDGLVWSRNLLTYTSPVRLEERRLGWLYLESDITDLQDRLRRFESRDVLELRVAARTSELELEVKERTRAEHELRQRTIFLNTLITNNPLAIAVGGPGGKLELVNPAFEKLFGY